VPVLFDRRQDDRRDEARRRRLHVTTDVPRRPDRSRQIHSLLLTPILRRRAEQTSRRYRVTAREGLVATVYTAWERAEPEPDGGRYRRIDSNYYRKIGSSLQDLDRFAAPEEMEEAYLRQYHRAYRLIYRIHPELKGRVEELDGEIVLR